MKISLSLSVALLIAVACAVILVQSGNGKSEGCFIGAFIADQPTSGDIRQFESEYGKKPYIVMVFIEWGAFVKEDIVKDVYGGGSVLMVTWEPWSFSDKKGVDFDKLLAGGYDGYIKDFALKLKGIDGEVFLRFAHEPNGDWYPWSAAKIGAGKYIAVYRYVKDIFDREGAANVKWVFSVNWEDVPASNRLASIYPGDSYADYIGIDGYNWGSSQSWSSWMSFGDIFRKRYEEISRDFKQPVMISEFGSSSAGGDKRLWIEEAMAHIKRLKRIEAFVLFNVDKETDWKFIVGQPAAGELKRQLSDGYFKGL